MRALLSPLAMAACFQSQPLALPTEATRDGSALFATRADGVQIFAEDLVSAPPVSIGEEDLFLLLYDEQLDVLGLSSGEQPPPNRDAPDDARPFPPGFVAYRSAEDRTWIPQSQLEIESVFGTRVLLPPSECEPIGCEVRDETEGFEFCERPCVTTSLPTPPAVPAPPARPMFGACPDGWQTRPSAGGDVSYCEPPAVLACAAGEAAFLGDGACSTIAAPCGAGGFSDEVPIDALFVSPGSSGGGSRASPYGTIGEAVLAASDGDVVALSSGQHMGAWGVDRSIAIVGCSGASLSGGLEIRTGASVSIASVSIQAAGDGLTVEGTATLDSVEVSGGRRGVFATGSVGATSLVARGASEGGIVIDGAGATVTLSRIFVAGNERHGISVRRGSLSMTDAIVTGSRAFGSDPQSRGYGLLAQEGATVVVERALFDGNSSNDLALWGVSATLDWIASRSSGGLAIDVALDADADIEKVVAIRPSVGALWFNGGSGRAADVYITGSGSRAATVLFGGDMTLERVLIEKSTGQGITVDGASAMVRDLTVLDQEAVLDREGDAIVILGGEIDVERASIDGPRRDGIAVYEQDGRESLAVLCDITVSGDRNSGAYALYGRQKTRIEATRFSSNQRPMRISSFEEHVLRDIIVRGAYGTGISVRDGSYDVDRVRVEEIAGVAIEIDGGFFGARNVHVRHTVRTEPESATTGLGIRVFGDQSLMAIRLGHLGLARFLVEGNQEIGVEMDFSATALIDDGEIAGSKAGFVVNRQEGFKPEETLGRVIYRNNETNVVFDRAER